jgi:glycosyltransferase involved in cell wall biosynthesis
VTPRVLVVTSGALFVRGGHITIAEETTAALRRAGYVAELAITPQNRFGRTLSAYAATWLTDVGMTADGQPIDQVISFRYPSYAVRHPRHVCWLNHRMREYYDLWERFVRGLGRKGRVKESIRRKIYHSIDHYLLTRNVTRLVAQSRTIQARLARFGRMRSELLYPPPPERRYWTRGYGDYVFAVSRLHPLKRLDLLVEAAALVRSQNIGFKIAGTGEDEPRLRERIRTLGLEGRVQLLGAISDDELLDHYARCRAVFFAPWNEDYGFVTMEAFRSGKAVITTPDSGGPAELVQHDVNGVVAELAPQGVADQIDRLAMNDGLAERLGEAALRASQPHTWPKAIEHLLRD